MATVDLDPSQTVETWWSDLEDALRSGSSARIAAVFHRDVVLRDLLVFAWDLRNATGADSVAGLLAQSRRAAQVRDFAFLPGTSASVADDPSGAPSVSAFVTFAVDGATCRGWILLVLDGTWQCRSFVAELLGLDGIQEAVGAHRPIGKERGVVPGRVPWHELRAREGEFLDGEPQVVVVGAGHCGLAIAARLGRLGISTLVVERHERVGDNWRQRYPSLALHDPVGLDHMPYLPLPQSWTRFTPKEKVAGYLEFYASALDLNVWTSATIEGLSFDTDVRAWDVAVRRADGTTRTLRPRHLVVATGQNGIPRMPDVPGADEFGGTIVHSGRFGGGAPWAGKRALVVGAGVSAHDVAKDLYEQGAHVTMLQRGSTYVINETTFHELVFGLWNDPTLDHELADILGAATPYGHLPELGKGLTAAAAALDRETLDGLSARGFSIQFGPDGMGMFGLAFVEKREGFYINDGGSTLIVDGLIDVVQGSEIESFEAGGVVTADGRRIAADLVVFATGYGKILDASRELLGAYADAIDTVFTVGDDGEMANVWRPTAQEGLWFMAGNYQQARYYSRLLALQIAALETGASVHPASSPAPHDRSVVVV